MTVVQVRVQELQCLKVLVELSSGHLGLGTLAAAFEISCLKPFR